MLNLLSIQDKTFFEVCETPEYACEVTLQVDGTKYYP